MYQSTSRLQSTPTRVQRADQFVERKRLDAPVDQLLSGEREIATVWATSGSGKTTLLRQWMRKLESAGVTVVFADSKEFFNNPVAHTFGEDWLNTSSGERRCLILDDAHRVAATDHVGDLEALLQALPESLTVVLAGRFRPTRSLTFLEAAGVLVELRMNDLSFNFAETSALNSKYGHILDDQLLLTLLDRTAGWAAALVLAMSWLRDTDDPHQEVAHFDGDHRSVADFLVNTVLDSLTENERSVLTQTALSEVVPDLLAVELAGVPDACEILSKITDRVSLLTHEADGYHFHPILITFLQARAKRHDRDALAGSHAAASKWHLSRNDVNGAITEAALSGQPAAIEAAIERFGLELMLRGDSVLMLRATAAYPPNEVPLSLIATSLLFELPDFIDTVHVSHLFGAALPDPHLIWPCHSGWLAVIHALHCFQTDSSVPLIDRSARLGMPDVMEHRRTNLAVDLISITAEAWCAGQIGDALSAQRKLRDVGISAMRAGYSWLNLLRLELGTRILSQNGQWEAAARLEEEADAERSFYSGRVSDRVHAEATIISAERAYRRCEPLPSTALDQIIAADPRGPLLGLGIIACALRNFSTLTLSPNPRPAFQTLDRMIGDHGRQAPRLFATVSLQMVCVALALDGRQSAIISADKVAKALGSESLEAKNARFALKMPIRIGDPAEADLIAAAEPSARTWRQGSPVAAWHSGASVAAWLLLASSAEQQGRHDDATERLTHALRLSLRFGTIQPFLTRNGEGANLLASRLGRFGPLNDFAIDVRQRVAKILPATTKTEPALSVLLTEREHNILNELPLHQSVGDIAASKLLSINTVKSHLRSIYQKLGVSNRSDAVIEARKHGLL